MGATTIRMDDELKAKANALLDSMGLSFNTFVNMASIQLVSQRRIPFDVSEPVPTLPAIGHVAANGVSYEGLDRRDYPKVSVPDSMVLDPKRDDDGTMLLPSLWRDDE